MGLPRGRSRGRVQGVPPPPEMTCCFLIQLPVIYSAKNYTVLFDMYSQQFTLYYCLVKSFLFVFTFRIIIINFVSVTSQLHYSSPVHPLLRKILDLPHVFKQWKFFLPVYVAKSVSMTYLTFWLLTHKKP